MSYIWENYKADNYYYIAKHKQSYYEEIWKKCEKYIPVNVYNRFINIFFPETVADNPELLKELYDKYTTDEKYRDIVNLIIHQLIYFDRLRGMTLDDIKMSLIYDEIENLYFGEDVKNKILKLKFDDLYIILSELVKKQSSMDTLFDEVLYMLFGKIIIYKEQSSGKTIVYIEKIRNIYRENLYSVAQHLFADLDLDLEVMWANEHCGIIGNSSTMKVNKISIY